MYSFLAKFFNLGVVVIWFFDVFVCNLFDLCA